MRKQRDHETEKRKQNCGRVRNISPPGFCVEHITVDRIPETKMNEQRDEKRERQIVDHGNRSIEILFKPQRVVYVEHKSDEAKSREMDHERRAAALFEKDEKAH